ncbi:hypothetical protein BC938DRAFT_480281 [Jimgerdemannia flammicorona]|uniref:Uncharacterized protein n=1 Tax=Jimgerdemannia flammicorona TaxID=994334 RepID=A0A433QJ66_9FUNG|nr:hypothetical protein BC938DRAFT_480281 [Jimgerdemannia flammicorona]
MYYGNQAAIPRVNSATITRNRSNAPSLLRRRTGMCSVERTGSARRRNRPAFHWVLRVPHYNDDLSEEQSTFSMEIRRLKKFSRRSRNGVIFYSSKPSVFTPKRYDQSTAHIPLVDLIVEPLPPLIPVILGPFDDRSAPFRDELLSRSPDPRLDSVTFGVEMNDASDAAFAEVRRFDWHLQIAEYESRVRGLGRNW